VAIPDRRLDGFYLVGHLSVAAGQERATIDHHVDLVGDLGHLARLLNLELGRDLATGKARRDRGHQDGTAAQQGGRVGCHGWIDADRRHRRDHWVPRVGALRLGAQHGDASLGVRALQSGQVGAPDGQVERPQLGRAFDGAAGEQSSPRLHRDRVDAHRGGRWQHGDRRAARSHHLAPTILSRSPGGRSARRLQGLLATSSAGGLARAAGPRAAELCQPMATGDPAPWEHGG